MLALASGFGDACDPNDPSGSASACVQCSGDWGIPGSCGANALGPQFNYSGWPCSSCSQIADPAQLNFCQQACGNAVAQAQLQPNLTAQTVSSLPSGVSPSSTPNLPGTPAASSIVPATNWWRIGTFTIVGLIAAFAVYRYTRRAA